jgi:SAM-dependent methyltransferase
MKWIQKVGPSLFYAADGAVRPGGADAATDMPGSTPDRGNDRRAHTGDACGVCASPGRRPWLRHREWSYMECTGCSAVGMSSMPAAGWAASFYDVGYFRGGGRVGYLDYIADEAQHRLNARDRVRLARRFGADVSSRWLDVGCAVGYTLDEARKSGCEVLGVELSEWAATLAHDKLGLPVKRSMREALDSRGPGFDVVSFFQVLEHMPDPVAALKDARACLRNDGLLVVETWDRGSAVARLFGRRWQQIAPPSVLWLFDRASLGELLERSGFRMLTIERTSKKISVGWAAGLLADKAPAWLAGGFRKIATTPLGRMSINYRLGDLVTVVGVAR